MKFSEVLGLALLAAAPAKGLQNTTAFEKPVQVKNPFTRGKNSLFGTLTEMYMIPEALELTNLLQQEGAVRLAKPDNMKHATPAKLMKYMPYSFASICSPEEFNTLQCFCANMVTDTHVVEARHFGALAMVALVKEEKIILVSYRHTFTGHSKELNTQFQLTTMPRAPRGVGVHYGFLAYTLSLQQELEDTVEKFIKKDEYKDYTLTVLGYSSGGTFATLSIPDWIRFLERNGQKDRKIEIINYAGSRPGNQAFADYIKSFDIPITRYTRLNDMVPNMPPRGSGYVHVGVEIHERAMGNQSALVVCSQDYDEDPNCILGESLPPNPALHFLPAGKLIINGFGCTPFHLRTKPE
ncbi:hypothetical protein DSO57_1025324 [Entomophthora muscae]|uniref:Uncharacterized protein n=1 Tax=Entomophthora muscae TaxID=34485 RepID=A0ACC2RTA1_9FUNG|nr:hypothetical protein DSO57_1025324 [Entomophthora muscae]